MINYELLNALMGYTLALVIILILVISIKSVFKFIDIMTEENKKDKNKLKKEIIEDIKREIKNK